MQSGKANALVFHPSLSHTYSRGSMKKHSSAICPRCKDADFVEVVEMNTDTMWLTCKSCLLYWNELTRNVTASWELRKSIRHHLGRAI
jgi:hypothetical protein